MMNGVLRVQVVAVLERLEAAGLTLKLKKCVFAAESMEKFVEAFGSIAALLTKLLKKYVEWCWMEEQQFAFETVKAALTAKVLLGCPEFSLHFRLVTDASAIGLGACLMQDEGRGWQPIGYASKVNSNAKLSI
ncbi:unnamed protein product [Phytophthora fragariaefolia]|uniref:Unnamed protein product n=1 Tax=Phytophthora fragariaefolia TaxID=1490495 RepID=A0A9W7CU84_9STRA|nr:unnamed protein product [Phytophthora fragariaefolia]